VDLWNERILPRVHKAIDGCWLWEGADNGEGYGVIRDPDQGHRITLVHKVAAGMRFARGWDRVVDHLCRVRCCVNPAHLEIVTHRENLLRGHRAIKEG
jgi:hypothetical protein